MRSRLIAALIALALCASAAGCGNAKDNTTTQKRYSDDGYMGMSTANPGILTSPNSRTYGHDTDNVDIALRDVPHIRRKTVQFNGGTMIVRIKVTRDLSEREVAMVRADAKRRLIAMFPRYDVRVRVSR